MTSSLVGSEMCIRDRHKRRRLIRAHGQAGVQERGIKVPAKISSTQHTRSCLLYTSDAADDM
eukprot:82414-Prorocentrum_lima.AAC.1